MYRTLFELNLDGNSLAYVKVFPSSKSFYTQLNGGQSTTSGLCGRWSLGQMNPRYCDLFLMRGNKEECVVNGFEQNDFADYWK